MYQNRNVAGRMAGVRNRLTTSPSYLSSRIRLRTGTRPGGDRNAEACLVSIVAPVDEARKADAVLVSHHAVAGGTATEVTLTDRRRLEAEGSSASVIGPQRRRVRELCSDR